ncbi:MAG: phosphoribosylamine--glycine ligase [Candidatus Omnitrophica bacterium]|nr:phosphoribosylamine--glycine ligase [Candidatus Omnitrophota bacterium]
MKVLIIGSGGREHALAWKIKQSSKLKKLYCAPGNGGMATIAECVDIKAEDINGLVQFVKKKKIDLTVVGPEAPLVAGIVDAFEEEELMVFGPDAFASKLEGSKIFAKEFMDRWGIPTADFRAFDDVEEARDFLHQVLFPVVIKADGLAAGKGVMICENLDQALEALDQIMKEKVFKEAGNRIIVEECLVGEEASILAISDGENYCILDSSQDHKRIFDDDVGPNTGGMGAYSPAPVVTEELLREIELRVIEPTILGMHQEGHPFKGVLYAGLMMTSEGPQVLEFNVRFGDPEAQAVIPRLKNDLLEVMVAACEGRLDEMGLIWDPRSCVSVVMSSGGYPGEYEVGKKIEGLDLVVAEEDTVVFHAGTKFEGDDVVTSGGRVLGVTSLGEGLETAIERAYTAVEKIKFDRCFFRRDIGAKALRRMAGVRRT